MSNVLDTASQINFNLLGLAVIWRIRQKEIEHLGGIELFVFDVENHVLQQFVERQISFIQCEWSQIA